MEKPNKDTTAEHVIALTNTSNQIHAEFVDLSDSSFRCVKAEGLFWQNVNLTAMKITDANLSDLEIDGAQLGGAYIHDIGMPPEGHPAYDPNAEQRPLRFANCQLNGSTFHECQLVNVELTNCNITGLKVNGVEIEELLSRYQADNGGGGGG